MFHVKHETTVYKSTRAVQARNPQLRYWAKNQNETGLATGQHKGKSQSGVSELHCFGYSIIPLPLRLENRNPDAFYQGALLFHL